MKFLKIILAIALTITIWYQANAQTYQGYPVKFTSNQFNLIATTEKEFSIVEAETFFKFIDKNFTGSRHKDRYLVTPTTIYHRRAFSFPFKNKVSIKPTSPNYGKPRTGREEQRR
jgi:hypothetical protein